MGPPIGVQPTIISPGMYLGLKRWNREDPEGFRIATRGTVFETMFDEPPDSSMDGAPLFDP